MADIRHTPYIALCVYAVAMAFLEATVVVYLRELYHPAGFRFPLQPIDPGMALTELGREAATVVMIGAVAKLGGGGLRDQFAAFAFVFAVWDVLYYAFLKVLIGWPQGLFDPDILFLIPTPWVGPAVAPMLVSVQLIILAFLLRPLRPTAAPPLAPGRAEWVLYLLGASLILWTFLEPNIETASLDSAVYYPGSDPAHPGRYRWEVFAAGFTLGITATTRMRRYAEAATLAALLLLVLLALDSSAVSTAPPR